MEKNDLKDKKEIRVKLTNTLHETLKNLGVSKEGKKVEKIVEKASRKLAAKVADRMKKESKKSLKANSKLKKAKKDLHEAVAA